ncbi:MAG: hypothetical protein M1831_002553 [Alyxoria varia]|nr:MAG: hypothetical protein M1831_002553 [Alyxoria varia]
MAEKERLRKWRQRRQRAKTDAQLKREKVFKRGSKMFPELSRPYRHPEHRVAAPPERLKMNGVRKKLFPWQRKPRSRPWIPVPRPAIKSSRAPVAKNKSDGPEDTDAVTTKKTEFLNRKWLGELEEMERNEINKLYGSEKKEFDRVARYKGEAFVEQARKNLETRKSQAWIALRNLQKERSDSRKEQEVRRYMSKASGDDMSKAKDTWIIWYRYFPRNFPSWTTEEHGAPLRDAPLDIALCPPDVEHKDDPDDHNASGSAINSRLQSLQVTGNDHDAQNNDAKENRARGKRGGQGGAKKKLRRDKKNERKNMIAERKEAKAAKAAEQGLVITQRQRSRAEKRAEYLQRFKARKRRNPEFYGKRDSSPPFSESKLKEIEPAVNTASKYGPWRKINAILTFPEADDADILF